jgi:GNAT superfamily N-acetyltransferase
MAAPHRLRSRVQALAQLAAGGRYDVVADEVFSRVLPSRNPYLNWDKFYIIRLEQPHTVLARPPAAPSRATLKDIQALCAQHPDQAELFRRRLEDGHECYVFRDGDRIVARQWLIPDREHYVTNSGWRFVLPERPGIWAHDLFIDPTFRLRGYFVGFMDNACQPRDGVRPRVYAEVHFRNDASLRACLRYGFEVLAEVTVWTLMGARLYVAKIPKGGRRLSLRLGFKIEHL